MINLLGIQNVAETVIMVKMKSNSAHTMYIFIYGTKHKWYQIVFQSLIQMYF